MNKEELCREIKSGAFSMQVADCERNIRIQFEKLQQENQEIKKQVEEYKRIGFKHLNDKCNKLEKVKERRIMLLDEEKVLDILKEVE